ncbi:MAG: hypothetical protein GQ565_11825 [Candidatus Aegiribacteria sp.]|nr:hypothetical protein [Candidatus Aegiribacteria sp.]
MRLRKRPLFMTVCVIIFAPSAGAQTEISGSQSGTLGPGTYLVTGEISVESGNSLTIAPGTTFFHNGNHKWIISGHLTAEGAEGDSILFVRQDPVVEHRWGGLRFQTGAPAAILDYCVIDHCYMPDYTGPNASITVNGSQGLTLKHSRVSNGACNNDHGGIYAANTTVIIENCVIRDNEAVNHPKGVGVFLENCTDSQILYSVIGDNRSDGA